MKKKLRVLLVMEQCNPEQPSVPLVGYHFFRSLSAKTDITLCTHGRNEQSLRKVGHRDGIVYIYESKMSTYYYRLFSPLMYIGGVNWPLSHALFYPIYAEFNRKAYRHFHRSVEEGKYDIVHALTPILPRFPVALVEACKQTPFILGPVNGGIPFPKGFEDVERKEFTHFNFLRALCHLIPGYAKTYQLADLILAGSTYTLEMLKKMFSSNEKHMRLFFENGVESKFFSPKQEKIEDKMMRLLFVGRLVPYKGADLLIEAVSRLNAISNTLLHLTIVGDGSERNALEQLVECHQIKDRVTFTGWIPHHAIHSYYQEADIFCFPSLREFGGAVVLEAMAAGLPSIVLDHGGIAEYVTADTGVKIDPSSKEGIVGELADAILRLAKDPFLLATMSQNAIDRAKIFEWDCKADQLIALYSRVIEEKKERL